jgi:hypothetical protein
MAKSRGNPDDTATFKGAGRVEFLAKKTDIGAMIEAGYPVKEIWKRLHETGAVRVSYRQFLHYVNTLILKKQPAKSPQKKDPVTDSQNPKFLYDPKNKDDLV